MLAFALPRRFLLLGLTAATALCTISISLALYLTRCDMRDYLPQAAVAPFNRNEHYLYACGQVWHSADGGHLWERVTPRGLPLTARDGHITPDRQPGVLYLGLLIHSPSSIYCWQCAWTKLRPAI